MHPLDRLVVFLQRPPLSEVGESSHARSLSGVADAGNRPRARRDGPSPDHRRVGASPARRVRVRCRRPGPEARRSSAEPAGRGTYRARGAVMRRYLIVANQTLGGDDLLQAVRTRMESGPAEFWVLVPATPVDHTPPAIMPMPVMGR